jgi:glycosyltransferase involved in cell wall biosynthesis
VDRGRASGSISNASKGKAPRILFVHGSDEMYGSDLILLTIVRELTSEGWNVRVVLPNDIDYRGELTAALTALGVPVDHMKLAVLRRKYFSIAGALRLVATLLTSTLELARMIRREKIDVVHTHTISVLSGAAAARLTRKPHVWHVSEIVTRPRLLGKALTRLVPPLSTRIVAISSAVRDFVADGRQAVRGRIDLIPNAIDPSPFGSGTQRTLLRSELGLGDRIVIGMVGRVGLWKGQEVLIDAGRIVVDTHRDVRFLLVGGVHDNQQRHFTTLRSQIETSGLTNHVVVSDFRRDIADVLDAIDIFVQPSVQPEPFGMTVLEAMSARLPVIASNHGGPAEIVIDGLTGFLTPPGDARALAERINELIDSPDLRREMGREGRRRVETEYALPQFHAAYRDLYVGALGPAGSTP